MKNSKGQTLPQPYFDLALMRREQQSGKGDDIKYKDCFDWDLTKERFDFWYNVYYGNTTEIPAESLAELEAWRKSRDGNNQESMVADDPEPDYKAMYDELAGKYKDLQWTFSELREQKIELEKRAENATTPSRNWIAECSMGIMAETGECDTAWNRAEAWAAEGKKRGRL